MTDFDKYKELYQCDFSKSITDVSATTYSQNQLLQLQREQDHQLQKLFELIKLWKDRYKLFCENFDTYSYTEQSMIPTWSTEYSERGYIPLPKSEFYIDEFFNMVLNKRAKFEIQQYHQNYNHEYGSVDRVYNYSKQPDQNIIISGNKFTIVGKDSGYRLDIKMNAALICSLIVALSNNYIIYDWYGKGSRFKDFIINIANNFKHLIINFNSPYHSRIRLCGNNEEVIVDIDTTYHFLYLIYGSEVLKVENSLHYNHLDKLFGENREKLLTEEDLQLYSIINEGRKPIMYDFEF